MKPPVETPAPPTPGSILRGQMSAYAAAAAAAAVFVLTMYWLKGRHAPFWLVVATTAAYGACILAITYLATRLGCGRGASAVKRRYQRRNMAVMIAYVVTLIGAIFAFVRLHPTGVLAYALAALPGLAVVGSIVVMGLYLREETDEFERAIHMESALWATGGALAIATVWGFLEMFHLAPQVWSWAVYPIWGALMGPAQAFARRRYQ